MDDASAPGPGALAAAAGGEDVLKEAEPAVTLGSGALAGLGALVASGGGLEPPDEAGPQSLAPSRWLLAAVPRRRVTTTTTTFLGFSETASVEQAIRVPMPAPRHFSR
jgi:hypothetical protein